MPRSTEPSRKGKPPKATTAKPAAKSAAQKSATKASTKTSGGAKPSEAAQSRAKVKAVPGADDNAGGALATAILKWLDDAKAEDIVAIDLRGKTSIGDCMIVATGRSDRHVGAIADELKTKLKDYGAANVRIEGTQTCDWVLVDVGAIVVNLFRPDVRTYYNLEKMWSGDRPGEQPEASH